MGVYYMAKKNANSSSKNDILRTTKRITKKAVKTTADKVSQDTKRAADSAKEITKEAAKNIKNVTTNVVKSTRNNAQEAVKSAKKVTSDAVKSTKNAAIETAKSTRNTAVDTIKKVICKDDSKAYKRKMFIQYLGKEFSEDYIYEKFQDEWSKNHNGQDIKSLNVYVKPEENTAYCVVNETETVPVTLR